MAIKISDEVVKSINSDRASGMTVAKIVDKYKDYGVTTKSIRRLTACVKKQESVTSTVISAVFPLATRKIGVKPSELNKIYYEHYGTVWCEIEERNILNMTQGQKSYIRAKVKAKAAKQGKVAIFVPEWMDRTQPNESNKLMLSLANDLYEIIEYKVNEYLHSFPQQPDAAWSVRNELYSLAVKGYDPTGLMNRCDRNAEVAEQLEGAVQ